jgi:hypothetical protein
MNPIIAMMIAQIIQQQNVQGMTVNQFGQPCEQVAVYQCLPVGSADTGSIAPTASVETAPRIFIDTPAMYSVFNQPQF